MRHPTYKHLESRLRIGAFTLGQWAQVTIAAVAAAVFGGYVSPLPTQVTIFVSVLLAGFPVAVSYGAMGLEFSVSAFIRAGWAFWHQTRTFPAGPGQPTLGYLLHEDSAAAPRADRPDTSATEGTLLWDV